MCAGKAGYTSAAIKRAAVHVWIAAKAAIITIFFILELHHANVGFGSLAVVQILMFNAPPLSYGRRR